MSDIAINLDGLIAFIAAAALSLVLVAAIIICLAYGWSAARRTGVPLRRQKVFPHIAGMSICLVCFALLMLFLLFTEWTPKPHLINRWLDEWVWLWASAIVLLWPLTAYVWNRRRGRESIHGAVET
jgi:hypothetical protein